MRNTFKTLATFIAILTFTAGSAMAATKIGVVGSSNPNVKAVSESGETRTLHTGDSIFLNDKITTTAKGSTQLMFLDKSALTVSPNSSITVDTFVYDPASKDGTMSLQSAKGAFRFIGGALTKKKPVKIKTPVSTIGIRGGIVDAHIANNGQTDAVFLFGEEMTLTNQNGQTSSTSDFGTGLTLANGAGVPQNLPKGAIINLINNSPVNNAANNSQSSGDSKSVDKKVNINTKPKANDKNGKGANNTKSQGSTSSGSTASTGNSANGDGQGGPLDPVDTAGDTPPAADGDGNDPAPQGNAFGFGTIGEGDDATGAGAPADVAGLTPNGENAQEDLRDGLKTFVENKGEDDRPLFDIDQVKDRFKDNERFNNAFGTNGTNNTNADGTNGTNGDGDGTLPPFPPTDETPIVKDETPVDDEDEIAICIGCACTNSCAPPLPARINTDNSVTTPTLKGHFFNSVRDNSDGSNYTQDFGEGEFEGEVIAGSVNFIELSGNNSAPDTYDIEIDDLGGTGQMSIGDSDIKYYDDTGRVIGWNGTAYITDDEGFHYYQLSRPDAAGETQHLRMIMLDSELQNDVYAAASGAGSAENALLNAINESRAHSSATNGIVEYKFLSDMDNFLDTNGNDYYGFYNYGSQLQSNASHMNKGLFVDYQNQKFMGGFINFLGSHPSMSASMGDVQTNTVSIDGSGHIDNGNFLDGYTYTNVTADFNSNSNVSTDEFVGRNGDFIVGNDTLAFTDNAGGPTDVIEGMIVEGVVTKHDNNASSSMNVHQGLVQSTGSSIMSTAVAAEGHRGFSAGLMMKGDGSISRIKTVTTNDVQANITAMGDVGGQVNYTIVDTSGVGSAASATRIDFGTQAGTANAALQSDVYAAEAQSGIEGVMMSSTHLSDLPSVCSNCQFAHWGVWSSYDEAGTTGDNTDDTFTGLVPYVAGQQYIGDIQNAHGTTGSITYNGGALGNFSVTTGGGTTIHNEHGTMTADIDLNTRSVFDQGLSINFTDVGGNSILIQNNGTMALNHSTSEFNRVTSGYINGVDGFSGNNNKVSGALFGTGAEDIGGNFLMEGTASSGGSATIKGAGIFIGTCSGGDC